VKRLEVLTEERAEEKAEKNMRMAMKEKWCQDQAYQWKKN